MLVEKIGELLRAKDLTVWLDIWELRPGLSFQEGIEKGLKSSRSVAVCLGAEGLGIWQRPEMRAALARSMREEIPVIPVLLPGCPESPDLALFLEALTQVDLRGGWTEAGLDLLVWGITGIRTGTLLMRRQAGEEERRPGSLTATAASRSPSRLLLVARNLKREPVAGRRFAFGGSTSQPTGEAGDAELKLPPGMQVGQPIKLLLLPGPAGDQAWMLVNDEVNLPCEPFAAEVVLMKRSAMSGLAAKVRDGARPGPATPAQVSAEERRRALGEEAARRGLTLEQLDSAIHSFAETGGPRDQGIAAYLENELPRAEELLSKAAEKQEDDLLETLRYLGTVHFEQAKYSQAKSAFRKALALHADDASLLSWLGTTLLKLADWPAAEPILQRALELDEARLGPQDPEVATDLNNLAYLMLQMNRADEAEALMRRVLETDKDRFGWKHPNVTRDLTNLAVLLQNTNRPAAAEPLMRRALEIDENLGAKPSNVARDLNNLANLLQATGRYSEAEALLQRALDIDQGDLGPLHPKVAKALDSLAQVLRATGRDGEAEPMMRRALAIDEASLGPQHPDVAVRLSNLAKLLLATQRFGEAEAMMRRALEIDESCFGPRHPRVAVRLNNLASLLQATDRLPEAEELMRRALDINESSDPRHPEVAATLHNLGWLLQKTNRLAEAEPLLRRSASMLAAFERSNGYEHPHWAAISNSYRSVLARMGRSEREIEGALKGLARGD